jgi:hypothetical protein
MKLNKTVLAVAIAGIAAAPMMASADTTLSGVVEVRLTGSDADGGAGDAHVNVGDVLVGVTSSHEMNNGLTAYGSLRIDLNSLSNQNTGDGSADNVYVGMKGGFGDLRFGEVGNPAEWGQKAGDLHDIAGGSDGGISYTGSFGAATVGLAFSPEHANAGATNSISVGAKFSAGNFAIGLGGENRGDQTNASIGASFAVGGASVGVGYGMQGNDAGDDGTAIAVKVGYGFGGVSAGLTFSSAENMGAETKMRLDLGYGLGGGMTLSARINSASDPDSSDWRVQLSKSF